MRKIRILWVDDEIELLNAHIIFLEEKGYQLETASNGDDAIEMIRDEDFDLVFLDENMPGKSGLETLTYIKDLRPDIPVVMVTKSEEEDIMEEAIGAKISDYLIKPVKPQQVLLSIKKIIEQKWLVTRKTTAAYQSEFSKIGNRINEAVSFSDWADLYKNLTYWSIELDDSDDSNLMEVYRMQENEANNAFSRFVKSNYISWLENSLNDEPLMSHEIIRRKILPMLDNGEKIAFILIDNLRYDQWRTIYPEIQNWFRIRQEELYCSILPTVTQYARNSIFAGIMPAEIADIFPGLWIPDEVEKGKNLNEKELLLRQLKRLGKDYSCIYEKVNNLEQGKKLIENVNSLVNTDLLVVVYNFVDILSHARTEMDMIRELANDESAYRSLTRSWFNHSPLLELIKELTKHNVTMVITTDHGTVRVQNPVKVIGDRQTSTNLRYKMGRNLNFNPKQVFEIGDPAKAHLPKSNISSKYIFASNNDFLVYPNSYNHYVKLYRNSFQHGGISMQEMILPLVTLTSVY